MTTTSLPVRDRVVRSVFVQPGGYTVTRTADGTATLHIPPDTNDEEFEMFVEALQEYEADYAEELGLLQLLQTLEEVEDALRPETH